MEDSSSGFEFISSSEAGRDDVPDCYNTETSNCMENDASDEHLFLVVLLSLTLDESTVLLICFIARHKLSMKAVGDLLELMCLHIFLKAILLCHHFIVSNPTGKGSTINTSTQNIMSAQTVKLFWANLLYHTPTLFVLMLGHHYLNF